MIIHAASPSLSSHAPRAHDQINDFRGKLGRCCSIGTFIYLGNLKQAIRDNETTSILVDSFHILRWARSLILSIYLRWAK
jgi:hypothetical protein